MYVYLWKVHITRFYIYIYMYINIYIHTMHLNFWINRLFPQVVMRYESLLIHYLVCIA